MNDGKKGKIGVLVEEHFDETEYRRFNEFFPQHGYDVEYISNLWNQEKITFKGNDHTEEVTVTVDVNDIDPADYKGIILIGGYAMDRLRYQVSPKPGEPNQSPAVEFLRKAVQAMDGGDLKVGTICHSMWLFCADPELMKGRKVTCAHNIICDVENAGGTVIYEGDKAVATYIDGNLISGQHPGVVDEFMNLFLQEIEKKEKVTA
ncbi:DJ-1/PfpI family protein [Planktothrix sp. FACHB-1355]|uniref:DJ-1/PfpI family protein n=1 Tax=Aerosakkonema funiforme FACHB-1375 TaxID=2949571 RepID=A0A926VMB7_9CYAN|nr:MULTISPECIES: DJ-1/PfpI family protein [Oscillatoriales]MBD2186481.1 DJ-1/PfpI family protein [Aerosakkonema funiforme FACHB-1375]MBD3562144.1 DJ-1/PfpI family protein [Planktothrix sp. FACHB-1355]